MEDSDLAGPLVFCVAFGGFLLLVSLSIASYKLCVMTLLEKGHETNHVFYHYSQVKFMVLAISMVLVSLVVFVCMQC